MSNFIVNIPPSNAVAATESRYDRDIPYTITLGGGSYWVYEGGTLSRKQYQSFLLPLTSIVSFRKTKSRTRVMEVTEQYLPSHWVIDIRGEIFTDLSRIRFARATDQKQELERWERIADTIAISGTAFQELNITEIEITDISVGQYNGKPEIIPFAIRAESHVPYEVLTSQNLISNG
jgi:hypothetical protein